MRAFMERMKIAFGQFDFIIDENGRWVFLEVNDQGNWLWLEQLLPSLPLSDCLVKFLASGNPTFQYDESRPIDFRFSDFAAAVNFDRYIEEVMPNHNSYDVAHRTVEVV